MFREHARIAKVVVAPVLQKRNSRRETETTSEHCSLGHFLDL